ncbi:hypothetical protein [Pseudomonas frederiksbergensis]|uniref:hypothetical protein n=1 Tax=Pseudomonas frederiksbergensis TaxID=104087 RepID=UPI003D1DB0B0
MSYSDLQSLKDEVLAKLNDQDFCARFVEDVDYDEVFYSKGPCFTIIPLELEMSGVTPSEITQKEPSNKKNLSKHYVENGVVVKVESYGSKGLLDEIEIVKVLEDRLFSLRKNKYNEVLWLKAADLQAGKVLRGCRVDGDLEYWAYRYNWQDDKVREAVSFASNGVAGTEIKVEYGVGSSVSRLFFLANGKEVDVYLNI